MKEGINEKWRCYVFYLSFQIEICFDILNDFIKFNKNCNIWHWGQFDHLRKYSSVLHDYSLDWAFSVDRGKYRKMQCEINLNWYCL
jgi:hypothetical protein